MNYLHIDKCDLNNGEGVRATLWVSGCNFRCKGCHNKESWDYRNGNTFSQKEYDLFYEMFSKESYLDGLSILGGEPLHENNVVELKKFLSWFRETFKDKYDIWLWTGYILEEIVKDEIRIDIIKLCDIVIDGRFEIDKAGKYLWRGSSNQRIINVKDFLKNVDKLK